MRWWVALSLLFSTPVAAQGMPARFNPAAAYITPGQDEAGYKAWLGAASWRETYVKSYHDYLSSRGVGMVIPTWQLTRTATAWRGCGAEPFEVPPTSEWPHIVETLAYVRDHILPVIGPVEAVSVYRNPTLNACAGGAADSAHRSLHALDMVPLRPTTREGLMRAVCAIHAWQGSGSDVGLGFYKGLRFHLDSRKFRKWGAAQGDEVTVGCPHIMARIAATAAANATQRAAADAPAPLVDPLAPASSVDTRSPPVEASPAPTHP